MPRDEKVMSIGFVNYFHGGIIGMIADSSMGFAALSMAEAGAVGVTAEYKVSEQKLVALALGTLIPTGVRSPA